MSDEDRPPRTGSVFDPWLSYPAFQLVRDPSLRPAGDKREAAVFDEMVERSRRELADLDVLSGLDDQQQRELAALVLDIVDAYERWRSGQPWLSRLKRQSRHGPGQVRQLARKIATARASLEDVQSYAQKVDLFASEDVLRHVAEALKSIGRINLIGGHESLDEYTAQMPGWYARSARNHGQPTDPTPVVTEQLVGYLQQQCHLKAHEAEVRTAKIGNALCGWDVHIGTNDYGDADAPAIRMRVGRRSARQSRTRKKKRL